MEHPRCPRRVQRADRRGAHLQPQRPRAVAAHQRDRPGRHGLDHGLRHARLQVGGGGRRGQAERGVMPPLEIAARPAGCVAPRSGRGMLVSDLTNIRWLTGFTGSNGWVAADARRGGAGHRRPLRRAGRRAAGGAGVDGRVLVGAHRRRRIATICWPPRSPVRHGRVRGRARHLRAVPALPSAFAAALVPVSGVVEAERRAQGRRRDRPHGRGVPDRRRRAGRGGALLGRGAPRPRCATSWRSGCASSAPAARATRPSWPPARSMPPCRITARPTRASRPGTR